MLGSVTNAEPPPEIKNIIKSFFVVESTKFFMYLPAFRLIVFGNG